MKPAAARAAPAAQDAALDALVVFAQRYPLLTIAVSAGATALLMTLLRPRPDKG